MFAGLCNPTPCARSNTRSLTVQQPKVRIDAWASSPRRGCMGVKQSRAGPFTWGRQGRSEPSACVARAMHPHLFQGAWVVLSRAVVPNTWGRQERWCGTRGVTRMVHAPTFFADAVGCARWHSSGGLAALRASESALARLHICGGSRAQALLPSFFAERGLQRSACSMAAPEIVTKTPPVSRPIRPMRT